MRWFRKSGRILWESKLEKFQGEADKAFLGWLYRVVQNHLLDQIRRAKRQPELAAPEEVDDLRSLQAWWEAQSAELQEEKIERVGGALRQLEDEHPQTARLLRRCYWGLAVPGSPYRRGVGAS